MLFMKTIALVDAPIGTWGRTSAGLTIRVDRKYIHRAGSAVSVDLYVQEFGRKVRMDLLRSFPLEVEE